MENNTPQITKRRGTLLPPPFMPYDYQSPIIRKMIEQVLAGKNGLVIQPTATGKSVEAAFATRALAILHRKRGLYIYDENEGLAQARLKFEEIFNGNLVTCANFFGYGKDDEVEKADMVFASFQSFNNHHQKSYLKFESVHFDYMIVNEGHHAQAPTYKEVIDYFQCPKIGMTATPKRMDEKDIMEIFHEVIFEMQLDEAIAKGYVAQIEYHMLSHNLSSKRLGEICHDVLEEGKRISIKQLNESIFIEMLDEEMLKEVYVYAFPAELKPRQTLLFCENIVHAEHVLSLLQKDGCLVDVVHSKRSKGHNRTAMKHFRTNKLQFLISVDKLNEDIDVPNVEVGVFLRSTDSENIFWQQLGRLLRKSRTKSKAIVLDFVANCERLMIVQDLIERIEKVSKIEGLPFQKGTLHVSGEGFDFSFSKQIIDVIKLIQRLREGFYPTWQEASAAVTNLNIRTVTKYHLEYKRDSRLYSSPEVIYTDFPGWPTFLKHQKPLEGWENIKQLMKRLKVGYAELKDSTEIILIDHPEWCMYCYAGGGKFSDFYHPALVKILIDNKIGNILKPGWISFMSLNSEFPENGWAIKQLAKKLNSEEKNYIAPYMPKSTGGSSHQYHPVLVEQIRFYLNPLEKDWVDIVDVKRMRGLRIKKEDRIIFLNKFKESNKEWFIKRYLSKRNSIVDFYSPILIKKMYDEYGVEQLKPISGWKTSVTISKTVKAMFTTIKKFAEQYRKEHSDWFRDFYCHSRMEEYYSPDLIKKIKEHFSKK